MKNCKQHAKTLLSHEIDAGVFLINRDLSVIEAALVAIYAYDQGGDYQKERLLRQLASGQKQHFVVDINGKVQLVYDSHREAAQRAEQLGGSVISGASK